MNGDGDERPEDRIAERAAALDDAIAAGHGGGSTLVDGGDSAGDSGLGEVRDVLLLLEQAYPRASAGGDDEIPAGFGRYRIVRRLGAGGFGIVFLAWDPTTRRHVALKLPQPAVLIAPDARRRFVREAQAAGALDHPNIVAVHDAGFVGGVAYLTLAYCPGITLGEWRRRQADPVPERDAAALVVTLAEAVRHAHDRGVLHRDLKPANVLLTAEGAGIGPEAIDPDAIARRPLAALHPRLTDFGLARIVDLDERSLSGVPIGSPAFMAPEQAAGRRREISERTEVYALGAILYDLLCGRPPFAGEADLEVIGRVLNEDPPRPRTLRPGISPALERIVLACLQKDPADRYPDAAHLAADLCRFLDGGPTTPPRPRAIARARRQLRRPMTVAVLALGSLAILAATGSAIWYRNHLGRLDRERAAEVDAARIRASRAEAIAREREQASQRLERVSLVRHLHAAGEAINRGRIDEADESLRATEATGAVSRGDFLGMTQRHLKRRAHTERKTLAEGVGELHGVAFSPDGKRVASAGKDRMVRTWDAASGKSIWTTRASGDEVNGVSFTPDGRTLLANSDDGYITFWDAATGESRGLAPCHDSPCVVARVVPLDGREILVGCYDDGMVRLRDYPSLRDFAMFKAHDARIENLALSPDHSILVTCGRDKAIRAWRLRDVRREPIFTLRANDWVQGLAVSHDGTKLAASYESGPLIQLFSFPDGKPLGDIVGVDSADSILFLPDDRTLVSAKSDNSLHFFDVESRAERGVHRGNADKIWCIALSPDGQTITSASADGTVKLWDTNPRQEHRTITLDQGHRSVYDHWPDHLTSWSHDPSTCEMTIVDHDWRTFRPIGRRALILPEDRWSIVAPYFTPIAGAGGQRTVVIDRHRNVIFLWNLENGVPVRRRVLGRKLRNVDQVEISGDGRHVAVRYAGSEKMCVWDAETGAKVFTKAIRVSDLRALSRGKFAVLELGKTPHLLVFDVNQQAGPDRRIDFPEGFQPRLMAASEDGTLVACTTGTGPVVLWDLTQPPDIPPAILRGHEGQGGALAFSRDGRVLATIAADHTIRLWDVPTHEPLLTLPRYPDGISPDEPAFSPDGTILKVRTSSNPGRIDLYDFVP